MREQAEPDDQPVARGLPVSAWAGVLLAGVALVLVAQFLLDSFADSSTIGHWIQHASLFLAGGLAGAGLVRLYQLGSRAA